MRGARIAGFWLRGLMPARVRAGARFGAPFGRRPEAPSSASSRRKAASALRGVRAATFGLTDFLLRFVARGGLAPTALRRRAGFAPRVFTAFFLAAAFLAADFFAARAAAFFRRLGLVVIRI